MWVFRQVLLSGPLRRTCLRTTGLQRLHTSRVQDSSFSSFGQMSSCPSDVLIRAQNEPHVGNSFSPTCVKPTDPEELAWQRFLLEERDFQGSAVSSSDTAAAVLVPAHPPITDFGTQTQLCDVMFSLTSFTFTSCVSHLKICSLI